MMSWKPFLYLSLSLAAVCAAQPSGAAPRRRYWTSDPGAAYRNYINQVNRRALADQQRARRVQTTPQSREQQLFAAINAKDPAAVLSYFEQNAEYLPRNRLANAFWDRPCPAHDAVVDWFYSDEIAKVPFDAYSCVLTRPAR